jgi:uncharacterized protein
VVKAGDIVKVKVMEVDVQRQRVGLSMRMDDEPKRLSPGEVAERGGPRSGRHHNAAPARQAPPPANNAMASAFAKLKR